MVMIVEWTNEAKKGLREIFNYYSAVAGKRTAQKIKNSIFARIKMLAKHPYAGQCEEQLKNRSQEFRYLVEGNYKILYWTEQETVFISSIFDCRQDPGKMIEE